MIDKPKETPQELTKKKYIDLPDHINKNDKIEKKIKAIFSTVPYDVVLEELKIDGDVLALKGKFLKDDTFIKSLEPELKKLYKTIDIKYEDETKKTIIDGTVIARDSIALKDVEYKQYQEKYITDEFLPISRVTELIKILMPTDTIVKFKSSQNNEVTKFNYSVNIIVKNPDEFFKIIEVLNNELYSINISYPISMLKMEDDLEIEFGVVFNQPR